MATPISQLSCVFGGTDEYVTMGDVLGFERTDAFSISCWIKTSLSAIGHLAGKVANSTAGTGWALLIDSTGKPYFDLISTFTGSNYLQISTTTATVNSGAWRHLVLTYSGSSAASGVKFYIDGVNITSLTTYSDTLSASTVHADSLTLGRRAAHPSNTYPYVGSMDEVAVYDIELTAGNVTDIYNTGAPSDLLQLSTSGDLVGWWRMGDGDTYPTLTDHGSGGNDGTMTNMEVTDIVADVPTGKFSLLFDGTNEYVDLGAVLAFERTDTFSLSAWVKPSSTGDYRVISNQGSPDNGWVVGINVNKFRVLLINTWPSNLIFVETTSVVASSGVWTHVCMTFDGSSTAAGLKLYVDGVEQSKTVTYDTLSATIVSAANLNIGRDPRPYGYFAGGIDEVAVYGVELTSDGVLELYNAGNPADLTKASSAGDLVGYWRCGDGDTYPTITDRSTNSNNGTMTNMESTDIVNDSAFQRILIGDPLLPIASRYSCVFDGTDEYVTMGNVLGFDRTDAFSVSCWVKTSTTASEYLVSKRGGASAYRGYGLLIKGNSNGELEWGLVNTITSNDLTVRTTVTGWNDGFWHHVVVVNTGTGTVAGTKVYVDGILQTLTTISDTLSATTLSADSFNISGRTDGASSEFTGSLDHVAVYDVALTAAQVSRIYNGHRPPDLAKLSTYADLVGWWKMGDGDTFPTLTDNSTNSNNGTMTNMEAADIVLNGVPLDGAAVVLSQSGTDKDVSQVATLTADTLVTLKDGKGYGANAWQWAFTSFPGPLSSAPTLTDDEAQEASFTPTQDGMYVVQLNRTDIGGESTDTQAILILDSEGHALPSAKVDGLINSSDEAVSASWVGRADAGTDTLFDAYLRWLKLALKSVQALILVSGRQARDTTVFSGVGAIRIDTSNFPPSLTTTFEVVLEASPGFTAEVRLYNLTDGATVPGSTLSTTSTSPVVLTGTLTMPSGQKDYEVQLRVTTGGGFATCTGARIVLG